MGSEYSDDYFIQQGIIQGSVLSPITFTSIVHYATRKIKIPSSHLFWYSDDLITVVKKSEETALEQALQEALATIGLSFNASKTEILTEEFTSHLGIQMNKQGICRSIQVEHNISNAL